MCRSRPTEKATHQNARYRPRGPSRGIKWHPKTDEFRVLTQPRPEPTRQQTAKPKAVALDH
ncbi:hypothetical protein BVI434_400037 [Burkholderia vietnamiensis]|nr:hypothetical protein BVI434_400037 [Burkholderia vietnamiensis]